MVSNKSRLLRLYRYLYVNTDEQHFATKAESMDALRDDESIYSRQTVRDDIDTLSREGYDIETIVSSGNYYYFGDREFTLDERRMMGDAIASSRFIGRKQKDALLKKLKGFCSRHQADTIERHLICVEPADSGDARIYDMVNQINDAICRGRKIRFRQIEAGTGRRRKASAAGERVTCTPLDLVWDGRNFHLIALTGEDNEPVLSAVADLADLLILDEEGAPRPAGFRSDEFAVRELASRRTEQREE